MNTNIKTDFQEVTPKIATEMLEKGLKNRALNMRHVKDLANQMKSKQWQQDGQPIRFDDKGHLMDGQHRLNAVILSETTQTFLIITGLKKDAFKVMDTGRRRGAGDLFSIHGIPDYNLASASSRLALELKKGRYTKEGKNVLLTHTDLLEFYNQNPRLAKFIHKSSRWYIEFNKFFASSRIAGLGFAMSEKSVKGSEEFWNKVCSGIDLQKGSPEFLCRKLIVNEKVAERKMSLKALYAHIILYWNAYRNKEVLKKRLTWKMDVDEFPTIK